MAFEKVEKAYGRGNSGEWASSACIGVMKNGVSFNRFFCKSFGVKLGSRVEVYMDSENVLAAFKVVGKEEEGGYKVQGQRGGKSMRIVCNAVAKKFPHAVNKLFPAVLNTEHRLIVADLNEKKG